MAASTLIALSEYLRTSYEPDREWVNGELRERNLGEGSHSSVQKYFMKYFLLREKDFGVRVYPELRLQVTRTNYRVTDVLVTRDENPFEEIVTIAPLLCIEILSPDDRMDDVQEKIDEYIAMGVESVWIVNPRRRKGFEARGGGLLPVEELTVPGTSIRVKTADVFAELDELEARLKD